MATIYYFTSDLTEVIEKHGIKVVHSFTDVTRSVFWNSFTDVTRSVFWNSDEDQGEASQVPLTQFRIVNEMVAMLRENQFGLKLYSSDSNLDFTWELRHYYIPVTIKDYKPTPRDLYLYDLGGENGTLGKPTVLTPLEDAFRVHIANGFFQSYPQENLLHLKGFNELLAINYRTLVTGIDRGCGDFDDLRTTLVIVTGIDVSDAVWNTMVKGGNYREHVCAVVYLYGVWLIKHYSISLVSRFFNEEVMDGGRVGIRHPGNLLSNTQPDDFMLSRLNELTSAKFGNITQNSVSDYLDIGVLFNQ